MTTSGERITQLLDEFRHSRDVMAAELGKVIVGQREVVEQILAAIFTRGHCLLVGVPGLLWTYLTHITSKFKITRRRVETEKGIIAKKVDSLELWRVLDVQYEQSLLDRIFGIAKIKLMGTDQSDPVLELHGMPEHRQLFETLRDAVQDARHTNRPMELVPGQHEHGMPQDMMGHDAGHHS